MLTVAGDLLRAEQARPGSQYGQMIAEYIKDGKIVPMEVTIGLLRNSIQAALEENKNSTNEGWGEGRGRFLVDGFPRKLDQSFKFEETVRSFLAYSRSFARRWCCSCSAPRK